MFVFVRTITCQSLTKIKKRKIKSGAAVSFSPHSGENTENARGFKTSVTPHNGKKPPTAKKAPEKKKKKNNFFSPEKWFFFLIFGWKKQDFIKNHSKSDKNKANIHEDFDFSSFLTNVEFLDG